MNISHFADVYRYPVIRLFFLDYAIFNVPKDDSRTDSNNNCLPDDLHQLPITVKLQHVA